MSMLKINSYRGNISLPFKGQEKTEKKETNKRFFTNTQAWVTGATAVASLVIAGIAISRSRQQNPLKLSKNNPFLKQVGTISGSTSKLPDMKPVAREKIPPSPVKIIDELYKFDDKTEDLRIAAEKKIRGEISEKFRRVRDEEVEISPIIGRQQYFTYSHTVPIKPDTREIPDEQFDSVVDFLSDWKFNARLRAGMDLSEGDSKIVKDLYALIEDAIPLEDEAVVFRGIRTQKVWDKFETLDFAKDLENGAILKERGFPTFSRVYDDCLAQVDPAVIKHHEDCGYIMQVTLPKGFKAIDGRRIFQAVSDKGENATLILPPCDFEIRHIDNLHKMIYANIVTP